MWLAAIVKAASFFSLVAAAKQQETEFSFVVNPFKEINWNPSPGERRKFALSLIIGLPSVAAFLSIFVRLTRHMWRPFPVWVGVIGLAVGIILWLLPQIADPFYIIWVRFCLLRRHRCRQPSVLGILLSCFDSTGTLSPCHSHKILS